MICGWNGCTNRSTSIWKIEDSFGRVYEKDACDKCAQFWKEHRKSCVMVKDLRREFCPPENIGRVFGSVNIEDKLEGSIINPNYCIVHDGVCIKHTQAGQTPQITLSHGATPGCTPLVGQTPEPDVPQVLTADKIAEMTKGFHKCGGGHLPGDGCDCLCGTHYDANWNPIISERPNSGIVCKCKEQRNA